MAVQYPGLIQLHRSKVRSWTSNDSVAIAVTPKPLCEWRGLQVVPEGVELLRCVAAEDCGDLGGLAVGGEDRHAQARIAAWRIEHETVVVIAAEPLA